MRRFNFRFALILLLVLSLTGAGATLLNMYQVARNAGALLDLAQRREEEGDLVQAASYYYQYLGLVPGDVEIRVKYGFFLEKLGRSVPGQLAKAYLELTEALQQDPSRKEVRRHLVTLGMQLDRHADAAAQVETLLETDPQNPELWQLFGQCKQACAQFEVAQAAYEHALRLAPGQIDTYGRLARMLRLQMNRTTSADDWIEKEMLTHNSGDFRAFLLRAAYWKEFGSPTRERASLDRAYQLAANDAEVLLILAASEPRGSEKARQYLEKGTILFPKDCRFLLALARLELWSNRLAEARHWLHTCLQLEPNDADLLWNVADLLIDAREPAEAENILVRLRRARKPPGPLDYLEGRLQAKAGSWLAASKLLRVALPQVAAQVELAKRAHYFLGECYLQLGNPDMALAAYRESAAADPLWLPPRIGAVTASLALGKNDAALQEYRSIQARIPEVRLALARLLILSNLTRPLLERSWEEATAILAEAVKVPSEALEATILQAEVLVGQNKLTEAEKLLRETPAHLNQQPEYWVARAGLAERLGQGPEVLSLLDQGEKRLGFNLELKLARARYWAKQPGPKADQALLRLEEEARSRLQNGEGGQKTGTPPLTGEVSPLVRLLFGLGQARAQLGHDDKAARLWAEVAQAEGQQDSLQVRLLMLDLAIKRLQPGQEGDPHLVPLIQEIRRIEGDDGVLWRYGEAVWQLRRAELARSTDLGSLHTLIGEISRRRPNWSRLSLLQARLAELEGQSDRAIREYRAAIDQGERRPEIVCHLAQLLYQRRRYLEAEKVIRTLPEQTPISSGLTKLAAEIALRRHEDQRALELALQALAVQTPDSRDRIWFSQILWANQRQEEAKAQLNQAIALARNQPDPYVAMIMFLARTGQREEAEIFLKKAQKEISPEQQPLALAQCFEALNQSERAEKQYQEAWKNRPRDGAALRALADFYLRQGQPYQAVPFLENLLAPTVLANSEDLAWARRSLAFALGTMSGTGDLDKVMKLLDDNRTGGTEAIEDQRTRALVLALQPSRRSEAIQLFEDLGRRILLNSDELFMLARLYEAEGNWRQARERLSSLVTAHPDRPLFMNYLVKALLVRRSPGNLAEAQALLHRLEGIAPEAVETLELKVRLLQKQDQVDSARAVIRTYAQKKNASLSLVAVLFELLGPAAAPEAEAAYRQLMETSKEDGDLIRFASFLSRQGRVEEALKWCSRLWENASPEIAAQTSLALLRGGKAGPGPTQQVAQRLQIALGKHRSTELMVVAAQLLDLQGRYEEAVAAYRAILQEDARHSTALNNLAWLLALKFQKPQEALATINRALDSAGPISTILDTRGVIYLHLNQPEPALKDFDQAVARTPRADFYFHRAQAFLALNRRPAAVDAFRVAQGLGLHPEMLHPLEQVAYQIVRVDLEQK